MKIMIVAGGTGGHLYPGVALARALSGQEILFVVRRGDLGRDILQKEGFSVCEIEGQGLPRSLSWRMFTFPLKFLWGWVESRKILQRFKPDWVVGMGGYLSFPVIVTAHMQGTRTLLHEQNVVPGLANRLLSRWADSVAVSFPASLRVFQGRPAWISGLPIRPGIGHADPLAARREFGLREGIPVVLVFGGSLGAQRVNSIVFQALARLSRENVTLQILHISGPKEYDRLCALYKEQSVEAKIMPYCHDMAKAYAAADVIVCRAGASTVAELEVVGRPALLIPYPYASNDHQRLNAEVLVKKGQGKMVLEKDLSPNVVSEYISKILCESRKPVDRGEKSVDAAATLARFLVHSKG